jgi:hypothetical protein
MYIETLFQCLSHSRAWWWAKSMRGRLSFCFCMHAAGPEQHAAPFICLAHTFTVEGQKIFVENRAM